MKAPEITLSEARRRYANARRRARFWSGMPTFSPWKRSNETRSGRLDEKYELAMCDCDSWEGIIERLTGKRPKHYNPKAQFAAKFSQLIGSIAKPKERLRKL